MKPEEVNEFLARWAMGWHTCGPNPYYYKLMPGPSEQRTILRKDWNPFKNIAQALGDGGPGTVVGAIRKKRDLIVGYKGKICFCEIREKSYPVPMDNFYAEADTPSAAICLAAVEALKMEKEK